jgi:nucleotide-binding universal stress UspA family protein
MALVTKILVPTDFSECARRAVSYGAELAAALRVPLLILHTYPSPALPVPDGYIIMKPIDVADMLRKHEAGLEKARADALAHGAPEVHTALLEGKPWQEIVRQATEQGCDLIVMGTHGRGEVAHLLLGSVTEKVVRRATCPVLTVGPRAETPP